MKKHVFHGLVCILLLAAPSSAAQSPPQTQDQMRDAIQLSRVLGAVHAIRTTCNGRDDQYWRLKAKELLDLEAPEGGGLRRSMAQAFNNGYTSEQALRPYCDEAAVQAEASYALEGERLADALAMSYFPKR